MENNQIKIIFSGTPKFGAIILEKLINQKCKPFLVITEPDKPVGRKQIITSPPVKLLAKKYNVPVFQSEKIQDTKNKTQNTKPDLIIVAAYGQILPKEILDIPQYGCLNVHPSLLPKYRGPSPIQTAILNGDVETGVSIMVMDGKIDHGPIASSVRYQISKDETYKTLHDKLADLGAELLVKTIPDYIAGKIKPAPQDDSKAVYTKTLKREDGHIDWKKNASYIERQIRALNPEPGTFAKADSKILKILKTNILKQTEAGPFGEPGKTFLAANEKIAVQTRKDFLIIKELQMEGKKPMSVSDFIRGRPNFIGTILK